MNGVALLDADAIATERASEDTAFGYLIETKPYIYRNVPGNWVSQLAGYLLLFLKRSFDLDVNKRQREDFFRYSQALSTLSNEMRSVRVSRGQYDLKAAGSYPTLEQLIEIYRQFIEREDDSASVTYAELIEKQLGLDRLGVGCNVNAQVSSLLDRPTLEAANIVTAVLSDSIAKGLPVEHVDVEPLTDYDAGQWQELVFTIDVNLDSQDANKEWDSILDEIRAEADRRGDEIVIESLTERIGVHFKWKGNRHVQP
jgi:hypothetical protein